MTHSRSWFIPLLLLLACSDDPKQPGPQARLLPTIEAAALLTHVSRLAHDSMGGRGSGTADERRAAQYIAQQFTAFGLEGAALLPFPVPPERINGQTEVASQNVIGMLPGEGTLRNEWIVLGAHYDHVGTRPIIGGSVIYNGADDNASGTALLLEMARLLAAHAQGGGFGDEPRRSVLFIAFGAEELGLIGSEHYCAQPRFPLTSVAAMLNFDMVGRLRDGALGVGGRSTASEWPALLTQQNTEHLLLQENDCTGCTDHVCFRRNNRPVLWFFTGFHDQYHQPADDTERINPAGLAQIANFAARITADLMLRERAPIFRASN